MDCWHISQQQPSHLSPLCNPQPSHNQVSSGSINTSTYTLPMRISSCTNTTSVIRHSTRTCARSADTGCGRPAGRANHDLGRERRPRRRHQHPRLRQRARNRRNARQADQHPEGRAAGGNTEAGPAGHHWDGPRHHWDRAAVPAAAATTAGDWTLAT